MRTRIVEVDENKHIHASADVIGANIGLAGQSVRKWCIENNIPIDMQKIDMAVFLKARKDRGVVQNGLGKKLSDTARKIKADADYKTSKARQEEMVTLQMMGELIPREQVKDSLEMEYMDIRSKLLMLPDTIKSKVYGMDPSIAEMVGDEVRESINAILKELASGGNTGNAGEMGTKPVRNYIKRKVSVRTTADTVGE